MIWAMSGARQRVHSDIHWENVMSPDWYVTGETLMMRIP
jgi:hypothetical protein